MHQEIARRVAAWETKLDRVQESLRELSFVKEAAKYNRELDAELAETEDDLRRAEANGTPGVQELRDRVKELRNWDRAAGARRSFGQTSFHLKRRSTELTRLLRTARSMLATKSARPSDEHVDASRPTSSQVSSSFAREGSEEKFCLRQGRVEILLGLGEALRVASEMTAWATRLVSPVKRSSATPRSE